MEPSVVESGVGAFDLVGEWNVLYGLIGFPPGGDKWNRMQWIMGAMR